MANNYLEQLVAEWYEYQGYFIRRNVNVGKLKRGGYEAELDVVGFHPSTNHLVHLEPSVDTISWAEREKRFGKKFDAGRRHIPSLFVGFTLREENVTSVNSEAASPPQKLPVIRTSYPPQP